MIHHHRRLLGQDATGDLGDKLLGIIAEHAELDGGDALEDCRRAPARDARGGRDFAQQVVRNARGILAHLVVTPRGIAE